MSSATSSKNSSTTDKRWVPTTPRRTSPTTFPKIASSPGSFASSRLTSTPRSSLPSPPTGHGLLKETPVAYIYPALRHGVSWDYHTKVPLAAPRPLPPEIAAGIAPAALKNLVGAVDSINDLATIRLRKPWQKSAPADYALPTESWREVGARRQRYADVRAKLAGGQIAGIADFITLNLDIRQFFEDLIAHCPEPRWLRHLWHALKELTVLDPTCGSGAFLFAGLNLLQPLYEAVLQRMEQLLRDAGLDVPTTALDDQPAPAERAEKTFQRVLALVNDPAKHPTRRYFVLKEIILRNLYGVDIMPEAVEICKLRLFLKLVAQVEPDIAKPNLGVEPLPDVDFNVRAGNTLVGFATRQELEAAFATERAGDLTQAKMLYAEESERLISILSAAEDSDRLFETFRLCQEVDDSTGQRAVKHRLKLALDDLRTRCDRALAEIYEPELSTKSKKFAAWQDSHQPFHWYVEFYGIMKKGGFATIIGNPPYVEYKDVKDHYRIKNFVSEPSGDLYAYTIERATQLINKDSLIGFIVPISMWGVDGFESLQSYLKSKKSPFYISTYSNRPSQIFDGAQKRLTIFIADSQRGGGRFLPFTTQYLRFLRDERDHLLSGRLQYNNPPSPFSVFNTSLEKIGTPLEADLFGKLADVKNTLGHRVCKTGRFHAYYTRKFGYFLGFYDFIPKVKSISTGKIIPPSELKSLEFETKQEAMVAIAALSSTTFFWFCNVLSDCRNLNRRDLLSFPIDFDSVELKSFVKGAEAHMKSLASSSRTMLKSGLHIQTFQYSESKPILDEIDCVLAQHYGFTEEELDFIVNYDIKYRLGAEAGGEEE
ncbi:MAG: hypothetical protein EXS37_15225 [Opitutus sp.]|nr:hypothetical protein [Opitutus sp.]